MRIALDRSPQIMDFYANPEAHDPYVFIKQYGSWLRAKAQMEDITPYEQSLLGSPGEAFLEHLERELSPSRGFKMVVLTCLIATEPDRTEWQVEEIAAAFKGYYLEHPERLWDYADMARAPDPAAYPLSRVASHVLRNPLHFLSNKPASWFALDSERSTFGLVPPLRDFWRKGPFRELVRDRVQFARERYFQRRRLAKKA